MRPYFERLDRTKLGFFYEIPILSHLLGARTNVEERTELLIFIRPHVMRLKEELGTKPKVFYLT